MFEFIKQMFMKLSSACTMETFDESLVSNLKVPIKCTFLSNQPCRARPTLVDISSYETLFYMFTVGVNKCGGNCNTIDDLYARVCKQNVKIKVFNLMSGVGGIKLDFSTT